MQGDHFVPSRINGNSGSNDGHDGKEAHACVYEHYWRQGVDATITTRWVSVLYTHDSLRRIEMSKVSWRKALGAFCKILSENRTFPQSVCNALPKIFLYRLFFFNSINVFLKICGCILRFHKKFIIVFAFYSRSACCGILL